MTVKIPMPDLHEKGLEMAHRIAAIETALKERDRYLAMFGGCGDGGCIVVKPKGQHTNGGCRCNREPHLMHKLAYANNRFADRTRAALKQD